MKRKSFVYGIFVMIAGFFVSGCETLNGMGNVDNLLDNEWLFVSVHYTNGNILFMTNMAGINTVIQISNDKMYEKWYTIEGKLVLEKVIGGVIERNNVFFMIQPVGGNMKYKYYYDASETELKLTNIQWIYPDNRVEYEVGGSSEVKMYYYTKQEKR